jgi:hypothetical protein
MRDVLSRRGFLRFGALTLPVGGTAYQLAGPPDPPDSPVPDIYPRQSPDMVREMVAVSHGNLTRVRELVEAHPSLARAAWDWGFGDFEDALGAASHVGNRAIAEYLIARGARPTLFSATMLGQLDVVKQFIAANPGAQRIPGPHSISLLSHAKAGGPAAAQVLEFLEALGDAGGPASAPISADELSSLTGRYVFGRGPTEWIDVTLERGQLSFTRAGMIARGLIHVGDRAFHPMGAAAVRIRFTSVNGANGSMNLAIHDPTLVLTAVRKS